MWQNNVKKRNMMKKNNKANIFNDKKLALSLYKAEFNFLYKSGIYNSKTIAIMARIVFYKLLNFGNKN